MKDAFKTILITATAILVAYMLIQAWDMIVLKWKASQAAKAIAEATPPVQAESIGDANA